MKDLKDEISKILEKDLDIEDFHFYRVSDKIGYQYDIKSTAKVVDTLLALIKKHEREVIGEIKVHFETMVFEDTHSSYDSFKFRKKQSMYLEDMLAKLKEVEK